MKKHANNKLFKANEGYKLKRKRKEEGTERIGMIFLINSTIPFLNKKPSIFTHLVNIF